jgi:hypothetical protein
MVIVEVNINNYEASTLRTLSSEYDRLLYISPIFSNLHRMCGKYNPMTQICNQMIVPCYQPVHIVIVDDATNCFDVNTP